MATQRLTRKASHKHAENRQAVIYQTLDDLNYEPPGDISAQSGEEKTITKPKSTCRVTKVSVGCSHVDDKGGSKKSTSPSAEEEEENAVRIDPRKYDSVPYQVVAPITQALGKQIAQKFVRGRDDFSKWIREDVLKQETIAVKVEGYFCEKDHPKVTVKETGRKVKSDTLAEIEAKETEVEVFEGKAPDAKGQKDKKDKKSKSGKDAKDSSSNKAQKNSGSSQPVLTSKEYWFYVGSLLPKYDPPGDWLLRFLYPRWCKPNMYEIHIETCAETRIIYLEAYYNAKWKLEFGRSALLASGDDPKLDWNPLSPFDESVQKLGEEIDCWVETASPGVFWVKIPKVLSTLFKNYKLSLKLEGDGPRITPQIDGETILKIVEAFTKLRENLDKRKSDGHTDWEFLRGHELKFKFLEGSVAVNWHHREHAGRRVGWYDDVTINLTLIDIEYGLTIGVSPSWTGHIELKGSAKIAFSLAAKGKLSSDSKDKVLAWWQPKGGKIIAWWQEKVLKKEPKEKKKEDLTLEAELTDDIREGVPLVGECKPAIALEIPVFLEELFNLTPKVEGGLEMGGFVGYDTDGPCLRMGLGLKDIEVSLEISALGGWISFTLGPVPIIKTEDYGKKAAAWFEKHTGISGWVKEGQLRLPKHPAKADSSQIPAPPPVPHEA